MGPKHRAFPLLSSLWSSIRSTHTIVGTRQCFFNGNSAFKRRQTFNEFPKIEKFPQVGEAHLHSARHSWTVPCDWLFSFVVNCRQYLLFTLVSKHQTLQKYTMNIFAMYTCYLVGIWTMNIYVSVNCIFELKVDVCNVWGLVCQMCTDQRSVSLKLLSCHSQLASVWDEGGDSLSPSPCCLDCLPSWRKRRNTKRRTSNSGPHQKNSWRGERRRELKLTIKQHLDVILQVIDF